MCGSWSGMMTVCQLAETAPMFSRQTINSIENGRYLPSLPLALAIARGFGLHVEDISISDQEVAT